MLHTQLATEDEATFQKEARTIATLEHPHIVRVLDYDVQNGTPILVMHYAANGTLRKRPPRGTRLSLEAILPSIKQLAAALSYAHGEKVIHRDIKPENMVLGRHNEVLLSDFGIATVAQSSHDEGAREIARTVTCMAPEQIHGKPRPASDQYSLGVVVYEWLTGERPFQVTFAEIATRAADDIAPTHAREGSWPFALRRAGGADRTDKRPKRALCQCPRLCHSPGAAKRRSAGCPERNHATIGEPTMVVASANAPGAAADVPALLSADLQMKGGPFQVTRSLTHRGHLDQIRAIAWSPDGGFMASASQDGTVQVWGAATGRIIFSGHAHQSDARSISWSSENICLASSGFDHVVQIWEVATGQVAFTYRSHATPVNAVAWSPKGPRVASASEDGAVKVWEALTGERRFISGNHATGVYVAAWSPDGQRLATGSSDKSVQVWNITGRDASRYSGHSARSLPLSGRPMGSALPAASEDQTVQVWEAATGHLLVSYPGSAGWVSSTGWSPDGTSLVSVGADGLPRVWDATSGRHLFTHHGRGEPVIAVAWSPKGSKTYGMRTEMPGRGVRSRASSERV